MKSSYTNLADSAKSILNKNTSGNYTKSYESAPNIQINWDSGFIALAKSSYDLTSAIAEIRSAFSGQWKNGLLPHHLFHENDKSWDFPTPDYWNSEMNETASFNPKTSGIIHPPIYGFVLYEIWKKNPESVELQAFIKEIFPKIVRFHDFLYYYRDVHLDGVCSMYHPWESARAESILWDKPISRLKIKEDDIAKLLTGELEITDIKEKERFEKYIHQVELGKRYAYDGEEIMDSSRFLVQDCMSNALLIQSNHGLIELGKHFGFETEYLEECNTLSRKFFSYKFWNDYHQCFMSYDVASNEPIEYVSIGSFVPLFAGLASEDQAEKLVEKLKDWMGNGYKLCPSFDPNHKLYEENKSWRGSIAPELQWILYKGLLRYGYTELAEQVKTNLLELVIDQGFQLSESNEKGYSLIAAAIINIINT